FVAILSLELGGIVGASIVADGVFRTGGLATAFLQSLGNADPFLLTALLVATAVIVCGFMLLGDIVIALLDPRIRLARTCGDSARRRARRRGRSPREAAERVPRRATRTPTTATRAIRRLRAGAPGYGSRPRRARRALAAPPCCSRSRGSRSSRSG